MKVYSWDSPLPRSFFGSKIRTSSSGHLARRSEVPQLNDALPEEGGEDRRRSTLDSSWFINDGGIPQIYIYIYLYLCVCVL